MYKYGGEARVIVAIAYLHVMVVAQGVSVQMGGLPFEQEPDLAQGGRGGGARDLQMKRGELRWVP